MSFNVPEEFYYTKDHEWAQVDENVVTVGITEYAQDTLGEVVYVELPEEGQKVTQGEPFGVVESVKAASDLYAPAAGTVVAVNDALNNAPETVNQSPYDGGWLLKLKLANPADAGALLSPADYEKLLG